MTGKEYISSLASVSVDPDAERRIVSEYSGGLPEIVLKIVSDKNTPVFLDDNSRILSLEEILDAETDLHVAFPEKGLIPLVDCGDNDFIVYHFKDRVWSIFNIIDETAFMKKSGIEELFR